MKLIKETEESLNFDTLNERDKKVIKEVIKFLKEEKNLNKDIEKSIHLKFKLKDVPKFNIDNSNFLRHVKKLNLFYNESGFLREGKHPNIVEYPIIAVQTEIRNFEKLYASIVEESLKLKIK